MRHKPQQALLLALALAAATPASADSQLLQELYASAQQQDPTWLEAKKNYDAATESVPQAKSGLLPNLSLRANAARNRQSIDAAGQPPFGGSQDVTYNNTRVALELRQTIYNRDRYLALDQADQRVAEAQATLSLAEQRLMLRLITAVFAILSANEDLAVAYSEQRALRRQLQQAEQRLEIGLGTRIDVEEARAAHDLAIARVLAAENSQAVSLELLSEITTDSSGTQLLRKQLDQGMPLPPPHPADRQHWSETASDNNFEVLAARQSLAQAEQQVERAKAGHYPILDLVGGQYRDSTGGRFGDTDTDTTTVGVELSVPLYAGGGTVSAERAAIAQRDASRERLEQTRRRLSRSTSESYLNVLNGIRRSESLAQAVRSSETALEAIRTGFDVGTRTSVDVVDAERSLSSAKRDLAQARHGYALDLMRLYLAAGTLDESYLAEMDQWLIDRPANEDNHETTENEEDS